MVDEFQDTDPVQWDIVRTAFGDGGTTLVLIGDPKQAIYAFRGADVHTYLDAAADAGDDRHARPQLAQRPGPRRGVRRAVRRPHARSSGHRVPHRAGRRGPSRRRAAGRAARCGAAGPGRAPRRRPRRADPRRLGEQRVGPRGGGRRPRRRHRRAAVVGRRARRARRGRHRGRRPSPSGRATSPCWSRPTARRRSCATRSTAVGVPAVIAGAGSVFGTPVAKEWLALLEALERPSSVGARPRRRAELVRRLVGRAGRHRRRRGMGGRVRPTARVGGGPADPRRRVAARDRSRGSERLPARLLVARGRRARAHRSPPHRPAAPPRGDGRAVRGDRPDRVAAGPHRARRPTTCTTRTAAGASSPTPPPCRS